MQGHVTIFDLKHISFRVLANLECTILIDVNSCGAAASAHTLPKQKSKMVTQTRYRIHIYEKL
jgi:hypothetical protein